MICLSLFNLPEIQPNQFRCMICICFKIFKYAVTTTFSESSKKIKLSFLTFLSCDEEHCCLCYYHQISTFFAVMSSNVLSSMDIGCEFFLNAKRLTRLMKKAHIWFVLVSLNVSASTSRFFSNTTFAFKDVNHTKTSFAFLVTQQDTNHCVFGSILVPRNLVPQKTCIDKKSLTNLG